MARTIHRLTALAVERAKEPALYPDGAGLYLKVSKAKTRSWVYRYGHNGKTRYAGLGPFPTVSLAAAREAAQTCRQQIAAGLDPIEAKRAEREAQRAASAKGVTFEAFARAYVESHEASWRDPKHCQQWRNTLRTDVYPKIGAKPVGEITTDDVLSVLTSIWSAKPESAGRIRGRIETILDAARVAGHREGENVARWRGHLEHLLPRKSKLRRVKHHAALPYAELPAFMAKLRARTEIAARALEFTILTAARTA
ncbi:MAG TPA: Arm DNA-binding domain-containing protein, partial [Hyphomicrobium sp.]